MDKFKIAFVIFMVVVIYAFLKMEDLKRRFSSVRNFISGGCDCDRSMGYGIKGGDILG
jgi:hypothetical protein